MNFRRIVVTRKVTGGRFLIRAWALAGLAGALGFAMCTNAAAQQQKAEKSNMELVGYNDLQGRSAYQPIIEKQGDRWIAYVGHHAGVRPNPLTGKDEGNGTSIVDVTDPKKPKYLAHIPGEGKDRSRGDAAARRWCASAAAPTCRTAIKASSICCGSFGNTAHEMWDVTDPAKPTRINVIVSGLRDTHKSWWECDTGIAYLVSGAARVARPPHDADLRLERPRQARLHSRIWPARPAAWHPPAPRPPISTAPSPPGRKVIACTSLTALAATAFCKFSIATNCSTDRRSRPTPILPIRRSPGSTCLPI